MFNTSFIQWRPWILALLLVALGGCGGGDAEEAADANLQPVMCSSAPEICR